jgi:hypothetical protein
VEDFKYLFRWLGEKYDGIRYCWNPKNKIVYSHYETLSLFLSMFFNKLEDTEDLVLNSNFRHTLFVCSLLCSWMVKYGKVYCPLIDFLRSQFSCTNLCN